MNSYAGRVAAALLASALAIPGSALAQSTTQATEGCTCSTQALPGAQVLGSVNAVQGEVSKDGATAAVGNSVVNGTQITTGVTGVSTFTAGTCVVTLDPVSVATVTQEGADVCVQVSREGAFIPDAAAAAAPSVPAIGNVIVPIGTAIGVGVALALGGGDSGASN